MEKLDQIWSINENCVMTLPKLYLEGRVINGKKPTLSKFEINSSIPVILKGLNRLDMISTRMGDHLVVQIIQ